MTDIEIRIACVEVALACDRLGASPLERARDFHAFVDGDEAKLACVRLAGKSHGHLHAIKTETLLEVARNFLTFAKPDPKRTALAKRGGKAKK